MVPFYEELYGPRSYLGDKETRPIRGRVQQLAREYEIADRRNVRLAVPNPDELMGRADRTETADEHPDGQLSLVLSADARHLRERAA
jgi:hypothetical protein